MPVYNFLKVIERYKYFRFVTIPLVFIILYLLNYLMNPFSAYWKGYFDKDIWINATDWTVTMVFCALICETSMITARILDRKLPWTESPLKRFTLQITVQILTVMIIIFVIFCVCSIFFTNEKTLSVEEQLDIWQFIYVCILVSILISAIHTGNFLLVKWKNSMLEASELKLKTAELKEIAMQAELQSLKLQLDPHFMFNNFSTLSELISEDKTKASLFLEHLSRVYRYMIVNLHKNIVSLKEELKFVQSYVYLMKIRHGEYLNIRVDIPESELQRAIPPITLQLLIENAIKHNIATLKRPLSINIYMDDQNYIIVRNNLQKIPFALPTTQVGLKNIESRYKILSQTLPVVTENEESFTVQLPILSFN